MSRNAGGAVALGVLGVAAVVGIAKFDAQGSTLRPCGSVAGVVTFEEWQYHAGAAPCELQAGQTLTLRMVAETPAEVEQAWNRCVGFGGSALVSYSPDSDSYYCEGVTKVTER